MLGFTLPLAIILGLESLLALLLLGPRATAGPALVLCRGTKTAVRPPPPPSALCMQHHPPPLGAPPLRHLALACWPACHRAGTRLMLREFFPASFDLRSPGPCPSLHAGSPQAPSASLATHRACRFSGAERVSSPQHVLTDIKGSRPAAGGEDGAAHGGGFPAGQPGVARV